MAGRTYYSIDIQHDGLNKFRRIKGYDQGVVEEMAARQVAQWKEQWAKKQVAEKNRKDRQASAVLKQTKQTVAIERTKEAQEALQEIDSLLKNALDRKQKAEWSALKRNESFPEPPVSKPQLKRKSRQPLPGDEAFSPKVTLLD